MSPRNVFNLAKAGQLGQSLGFEGYCATIAIDTCFTNRDIPLVVHEANHKAVTDGEIGQGGPATDKLFALLGSLVFNDSRPEDFAAQPYYFTSLEDLRTDLAELRGKGTILLDVNDGQHSVGLKPAGNNPNEWQIVGTHQIVAVLPIGGTLDVQGIVEPEIITIEQVWEYLCANNSPGAEQQTALIFPPEPEPF